MRVLIASLALLVAACGFQPMYADTASGGAVIGPVTVSEIEGKAGHVLKTELDRILAVENDGSAPMRLEITLLERVTQLGIRLDESATRAELRLIANYVLTPADGGRLLRGSVFTAVNYDIPTAAFGEIAAQDDARERAAETLAQRFRAELALRMAQRRAGSGAAQ
jgi:LPS-assembly lipoprotein